MGGKGFEAPKAPSRDAKFVEGVGNGEGVPLPSRLGFGGPSSEKRISVFSKRHRMPVVETFAVN